MTGIFPRGFSGGSPLFDHEVTRQAPLIWGGEKEAEPLSWAGAGRTWLGIARKLSKSEQAFFSNRLQQEQTNGFTPASAKGEIKREIGGDKTEKVVVGFRLIHSSGYPC